MIRKIISKQEEEKRRKRNQIIVGVVLVFIMIFSTLAYSFGSNPEQQETKIKYGDYEFVYSGGFWNLDMGGEIFNFINSPYDFYRISSDVKPLADYYGKPLYLYAENADSGNEIYRNMYSLTSGISLACPENEDNCDKSLPVKTCENNFIIIKEENLSGIYQDNGCVFISGPYENPTRITDGFLVKIIGVQ